MQGFLSHVQGFLFSRANKGTPLKGFKQRSDTVLFTF